MLKPVLASVLALSAFALPARAEDRPPIQPTRDVSVTYNVVGGQHGGTMRMTWDVTGNRMRVDTPGGHGYMIVDRAHRRGTMVMPQQHMYMEIDSNQIPQMGDMPDKDAKFSRGGTETIAGQSCTVWKFEAPDGSGTACLTADGVMLRATAKDGQGLQATEVKYGPVAPADFRLPDGYQKMDLGAMMQQGKPPQRR